MDLVRKSAPTTSCIDAALVLANCRVKSTTETELIRLWIRAAEDLIEGRINRSIMRQTFVLRTDVVRPRIVLYRPALEGSATIVKATTTIGGAEADYLPADVTQRVINMLPEITLPGLTRAHEGFAEIEYTVGASTPDAVSASIKQAVLLLASHWYRNREAVVTDQRRGTGVELQYGAESLVRRWRIPNVNVAPNEA